MRAVKTQTEIRQDQIAQAALDVIASEGSQALSIAAIADRVGIVPSNVYRHFRGKDGVLDAVLGLVERRLMENVATVRKETPDPLERLRELLIRHARMLAENQAIPLVVFSEGIYSGSPGRQARVGQIITRYVSRIEEIVAEGQKAGHIDRRILPRTVSVMLLGLILPAVVIWNVSGGKFDVVEHVQNAWTIFEKSIAAGPLTRTGEAPGASLASEEKEEA